MRHTLRRDSWPARFGLVLLVAFLATACASGGGAPEEATGDPGVTMLRVYNTDTAGQPLRIYLAREAGQARLLGSVAPDDYLTLAHTEGQGRFQFRAERPDGEIFNSPMFTVVSGTYTWDIALRRVDRSR